MSNQRNYTWVIRIALAGLIALTLTLSLGLLIIPAQADSPIWSAIGPSEPGNVGQVLIVTSTNTMYAGTVGGGIFKSTDNGVTWTASST